jgi:hypothetical protein
MIFAMGDIVFIGKKRRFTLDEAKELLPAVRRVTERAVNSVEKVRNRRRRAPKAMDGPAYEEATQAVIGTWAQQIERLGCEPKGLWLVDFDNGRGYFCWRYPEPGLAYAHDYDEGFGGREPIN